MWTPTPVAARTRKPAENLWTPTPVAARTRKPVENLWTPTPVAARTRKPAENLWKGIRCSDRGWRGILVFVFPTQVNRDS